MLCVPSALIVLFGYETFTDISSIVMAVGILAVLIFTTDPPGKTLFLQLTCGSINTVMSVILSMVRHVFHLSYPALILMLLICSPIVYVISLRFWAKPLRFLRDNIKDGIAPLLILPLVTIIMVNIIPVYPAQNYDNHPVYCTLMMLAIELIYFLYLYTTYLNLSKINILNRQKTLTELLRQEIVSYQTYLDAARQNRHDLRHHDALILEQLENSDIEGAINYLRAHNAEIAGNTLTRYCAEPTVNAILRIYERRAMEKHIAYSIVCDIPELLPFDSPELGSLLGNLLENAFVAATGAGDDAFIAFSSRVEDKSLLIELRNSKKGNIEFRGDLPVSRKPGGGTGTKSVRTTVENHGGIIKYSQTESEFTVRVIIPI